MMEEEPIDNRIDESLDKNNQFNLPDLSKGVIAEINRVRSNPNEYGATIAKYQGHLKDKILNLPQLPQVITSEGAQAFEHAKTALNELQPLNELAEDINLTSLAQKATERILRLDSIDEVSDVQIREFDPENTAINDDYSFICHIGSNTAEIIVMHLIVDDGDSSRENRNNILRSSYTKIGVCSIKHPIFEFATVIVLSSIKNEEKTQESS